MRPPHSRRTVTPTTLGRGVQFRSGQEEAQPAEQAHLTPQEKMADLSDRLFARALCLAARGGRHRLAQVARLDDRRPAVALLPASLDQDLIGLADEPKDNGVAGAAAAVDRVDGRLVRGERQEGQHLSEILSKFLATSVTRSMSPATRAAQS